MATIDASLCATVISKVPPAITGEHPRRGRVVRVRGTLGTGGYTEHVGLTFDDPALLAEFIDEACKALSYLNEGC